MAFFLFAFLSLNLFQVVVSSRGVEIVENSRDACIQAFLKGCKYLTFFCGQAVEDVKNFFFSTRHVNNSC